MITVALSTGVRAQNIPDSIPAPADAARIEQNKNLAPPVPDDIGQAASERRAVPQTPEGADAMRFVLQSVVIDGMNAYSQDEIAGLYGEYLGREISVATLFDIMAALQNKYLEDGYTLSRVVIPNQNIQNGAITLQVIEGYIAEVEIDPALENDAYVADAVREITAMRPLNTVRMERILLILNDLPDLNVGAVLAAPEDASPMPGAVRMALERQEERDTRARVSIDNYGSVFTGPFSVNAMGRIYNAGLRYSTLEVNGSQTTSIPEQSYGAVSYSAPVFGVSGARVTAGASLSRTEPGSTLDPLDVQGKSRSLSVGISYPLVKQRAETCVVDAEFDVRDSRTKLLSEEFYDDRLRVIRAGINYSFSDGWNGINLFDMRYSMGLDIFGARETGSINLSRRAGRSDFRKMNLYAGRLQALPHDFEIYALAAGQFSNDPLLSAEEFGFGGADIGRGYDPSELTGDRGISASIEVRHRSTEKIFAIDTTIQPYAFFDIGKVWNIDDADTTHQSGASAGIGLKIIVEKQWDANVNLAFPLTRPAENPAKYTDEYGPRVMFSLARRF